MSMLSNIVRELASIAKGMINRPEVQEATVNLTSARITVVIDSSYLEVKLRNLLEEAKSYYGKFGTIRELKESDFEDGLFELAIAIRESLEDLEKVVKEKGDHIIGLGRRNEELIVKILLKSSSVEKAIEPLKNEFLKLGFLVEYAGAELEASKTAIFTPFIAPAEEKITASQSLSVPLKYKAYLDLCLRLDRIV